jgi:hypothetical protein
VEEMTHRPLLTRREMRLEDDDREAGRHWRFRECWCEERHEAGDPDLVDPPWCHEVEFTGDAANEAARTILGGGGGAS